MQFKKVLVSTLTLGSLLSLSSSVLGATYYVQPGDSLYSIAARYGTTISSLQQSNSLGTTSIYPGQKLNIALYNKTSSNSSTSYSVRAGDTLYLIAQRYGVSISDLRSANNLTTNTLFVGQTLKIPTAGSSSSSNTGTTYQVQSGDTLYLIAQKYGITVDALKQANGITGSSLLVGQSLKIPTGGTGTTTTNSDAYTVKAGDTLYLIAQRYGLSMSQLAQANNMSQSAPLYPGQTLKIPSGSQSTSTKVSLSQSDMDLLARLVTAESDGEPFNGQVAVAATILNRLQDSRYPKTVSGIIYEVDNGCYQYSPVLDGRINLPASSSAYLAVQEALTGSDPSKGANGFYNPSKTESQWVRSQTITVTIGNHVFFSY